ncbi:MAG: hypothetical protein WBE92_03090 [Steroidobacteraceae bacterium]
MTDKTDIVSELEQRTRAVLRHSVTRIDARTRSRLNQARQAALAAAAGTRPGMWRSRKLVLMPVTGAVAAAVLATVLVLFGPGSRPVAPKGESAQPSLEVLDLLTDDESMTLMENYDRGIYEWAAAQGDTSTTDADSSGTKHTT